MSYNYYIGSKSNIDIKTDKQPFIISMDSKTKSRIESWLDSYALDFDELIIAIKSILHKEIRLIDHEQKNEFLILFQDYSSVNFALYSEDKKRPIFGVKFDENWYECVITENNFVEKMCEVSNNIKYYVIYLPYSQMIVINYYNVVIQIEIEGRDTGLYNKLKSSTTSLEEKEDLDGIFEWALENVIGKSKFIAITITELGNMSAFRFEIIENSVNKYARWNPFESYELFSNGSWNVTIGNVLVSYDGETQQQKYEVQKNSSIMVKNVNQVMSKINDEITSMWENINMVDEKIEQLI